MSLSLTCPSNAQASPTRDPRLQFGALSILGIVAPTLVVKKKFKQQLESLLATYVLPELAAEQGFLRMQAAEVLSKFTSVRPTAVCCFIR